MTFLEDGSLTVKTEYIQNIANKLKCNTIGGDYEFVINVFKYLNEKLPFDRKENWTSLFNTRTAEEILKSGFNTGCTDVAIVFVAIMRSAGYPAKYIETISKQWLKDYENSNSKIQGHVFTEVLIENEWVLIDPDSRRILCNKTNEFEHYVVYEQGLDPHELGITDFETMKKLFCDFRSNWQLKNP